MLTALVKTMDKPCLRLAVLSLTHIPEQRFNFAVASGLVAGNYSLTVTDENGCSASSSVVTISQLQAINISLDLICRAVPALQTEKLKPE
ncbi:MAG: hypothetical protein R2850_00470 [Bacteroidia bacterium]